MAASERGPTVGTLAVAALVAAAGCIFDLPELAERPTSTSTSTTGGAGGTATTGAAGEGGGAGSVASSGGGGIGGVGPGGTGGGPPPDWWDPQWSRRVKLSLDNASGEALADFPLLVTLDSNRIDYADTLDDGADIRFVADDGLTVLPHEIERWNETGTSHVWVGVAAIPAMSDSGFVTMYYGNAAALFDEDASGIWETTFAAVYHLSDDPGAPGGKIADSTGHLLDGVAVGLTAADQAAGQVGGGLHFNGM